MSQLDFEKRKQKKIRWTVSTIIPIYNIDKYLEQAVESVINQSIGFSNIQLILIDDGSSDMSSEIARQYAGKYPDNCIYKQTENNGVSHARNKGFQLASGEYVHFFDGDDILSKNFYSENIEFLNTYKELDFASSPLKFFDEIIDSHPLNYKFTSTRIINLVKEPDNPIMHVISCVFRREAIVDVKFDESLTIAEDVKYLSDVLVHSKRYGVLSNTIYHYRKRSDGSSAISTSRRNSDSYLKVISAVYGHMLDTWHNQEKNDSWAEYTILYDLSYRLNQKDQNILSVDDETRYKDAIYAVGKRCSDLAILSTRHLSIYQKVFLLQKKYGDKYTQHLSVREGNILFSNNKLYNFHESSLFIDFLTCERSGAYKVEGYINGLTDIRDVTYYVDVSGKKTPLNLVPRYQREESFLGDVYKSGGAFEVTIDIPAESIVSFVVVAGEEQIILSFQTGRYTRFGALKWTYRQDDGRLFKRTSHAIESYSYSHGRHFRLEMRMLAQILLNWRLNTMRTRLSMLRQRNLTHLGTKAKLMEIAKPFAFSLEAVAYIPRDLLLRGCYYIAKSFKKRPIWLVSDRSMMARDNGEALFRYIMTRKDTPANVYFVISKKSEDLARMKSIGKVLYQESFLFKIKFLLADKIIASQADIETTNPFIRLLDRYVDLFQFDFVFLQHGIIRHNLSSWLNRFEKNITLFITSADKEYNSIFSNPYYYEKSNILLSGLPRYDLLENIPSRKLILAPTYRKNLSKMKTDRVGRRHYDPTFKNTEYRNFYNNLMNDSRILEALREANMTGEYFLHPVFAEQRRDFDENELFHMANFPYDYQKAFCEGSMLISDHSSVVFDFAYLKKPIAYAHYDVETFFEGHSYDKSDFFSDIDDGFGEVYYDYETLVNGVVQTIKEGCEMRDKYRKRVDGFFHYVDKHNSERVYNAILELDNKGK